MKDAILILGPQVLALIWKVFFHHPDDFTISQIRLCTLHYVVFPRWFIIVVKNVPSFSPCSRRDFRLIFGRMLAKCSPTIDNQYLVYRMYNVGCYNRSPQQDAALAARCCCQDQGRPNRGASFFKKKCICVNFKLLQIIFLEKCRVHALLSCYSLALGFENQTGTDRVYSLIPAIEIPVFFIICLNSWYINFCSFDLP